MCEKKVKKIREIRLNRLCILGELLYGRDKWPLLLTFIPFFLSLSFFVLSSLYFMYTEKNSKSSFNKESYDKSSRHNIGCLSHEYCPVDFYYHSSSVLLAAIWGIKYKGHKSNANFLLDKSSSLKITQFLIFLLLRLLNICHHGHIKSYTLFGSYFNHLIANVNIYSIETW